MFTSQPSKHGGPIAVIEFAAVDAEELQILVEVGFNELILQELGVLLPL